MHEFLTSDEAMALLRVSRKAFYSAVAANEIPGVVRVGRCIRIRRSALLGSPTPSADSTQE